MTNYRRDYSPGATYFFTVNLLNRKSCLLTDHIDLFRHAYRAMVKRYPLRLEAMVVLPDHCHAIWTLPDDDADYSTRWRVLKAHFSRNLPPGFEETRSTSRKYKSERAIWQRRFWEHRIRDHQDFMQHLHYIHYNPVKHNWVMKVSDWPYSTFHQLVKQGVYAPDWGDS